MFLSKVLTDSSSSATESRLLWLWCTLIQIYENLGDHNSTAAWYTVDRITGTGTDEAGAEISLVG